MEKDLDQLLHEISNRWNNNHEKRKVIVFSDGHGHFWVKLMRESELTDKDKRMRILNEKS